MVSCHLGGFLWCLLFLQYLNTVIPYEKKGSPPSVEDLQMLTNSEYSFQLLLWVRITFWGQKGTFCFVSVAAVWGITAAQLVWGNIFCIIAAWAVLGATTHVASSLQQSHLVRENPWFASLQHSWLAANTSLQFMVLLSGLIWG